MIWYVTYILKVSDKLVITRLPQYGQYFPRFSQFTVFFTRLNAREISRENMRNSEIMDYIVLVTVR